MSLLIRYHLQFSEILTFFNTHIMARDFNPAQKGVLNKAGFTLHKSNLFRVIRLLQGENYSNLHHSPGILNPESGAGYFRGRSLKENSTVSQIIKPSAMRTIFFAEGCISGSQAIRACLTIRFLTISLIQEAREITCVFLKRLPTAAELSAAGWKGFSPLFCENENEIMNIKTICQ